MDFEHITYEVERGRARIILDRPEKLNAISPRMQRELHDALWDADDDPDVHSIILKGRGRSFCSGFDLNGYTTEPAATAGAAPARRRRGYHEFDDDAWQMEKSQRLYMALFDVHKPVVAQVHGWCLAGGTCLALLCDMVICADDARFGFPPARDLGALPSNMWLYHVGPQWAKRLTMTGDWVSGREAALIGLAMKSVPADLLDNEVEQLADRFALIDPHLLAANKRTVSLGLELMGARTMQRIAVEIDARAHRAPGTRVWNERIRSGGLREALSARDGLFGDGRARVDGPEVRDEHGRLVEG